MFKLIALFSIIIFAFTACNDASAAENTDELPLVLPSVEVEAVEVCELESPVSQAVAQGYPDDSGFTFMYRGTTIHLNQNMTEILAAIGEPLNVHETPSCAFVGFDRIFMFPGVQFHTYPVGDDDFLQVISIWDDSVATRGGIHLGAMWESVLAEYGTDYSQEFQIYTFTRGNTELSFFVENGVVLEISYTLIMEGM